MTKEDQCGFETDMSKADSFSPNSQVIFVLVSSCIVESDRFDNDQGGCHVWIKITDYESRSAISVDDTLKIITCREQQKRLAALQTELGKACEEGFVSKHLLDNNEKDSKKKILAVNDHVESPQEQSKKTKSFFVHAVEHWDAEFYAKVNDNVYVNLDAVGAVLASYLDKPRVYIGCMKSGEVFSQPEQKWYEPEWWKFGDGKSSILCTYTHDDVSAGSWFIGLDVKHVDEGKFCCSSWSSDRDSYKAVELAKDKHGVGQVLLRNLCGASVQATFKPPTAVRGGIPICFPQFGNRGNLEQHGYARNRMWIVDDNPPPLHPNDFNGKIYIDLLLKSTDDDLKIWPHCFEFRLRVALAFDGSLTLISRIRNINCKPFSFSIAYHTYFAVSDISEVRVEGLETLDYLDNLCNRERFTEQGDALTFESEVDRVYLSSSDVAAIFDHEKKRTFLIKKEGLPDVVVWNPWEKKSKAIADFGDEEYKHMLCVDGAAIEKPITLKPGEEWTGRLELSVTPTS
ncbi:hypothetical protein RND71_042965 [Anisodus tanguticus]|uniref:glucose-6-phosphate 1-epimerase n=1 Tax=Anisodus tanguticus TaxID=243964 RepID=A0AAE1QT99_9SOLA|nr:hypothetical protein RND71_042965 [Anisodus tanguticus]